MENQNYRMINIYVIVEYGRGVAFYGVAGELE